MFPIILAVLALLLAPTVAQAHIPTPRVSLPAVATASTTGEAYATSDPILLGYRDRAIDFWSHAGYPPKCAPLTVTLAPSLGKGVGGIAYVPQADHCEITLLSRHAGAVLFFTGRNYRNRERLFVARWIVADFCRLVTHEVGHIAGLAWPTDENLDGHPLTPGVMSNKNPTTPRSCWRYAKSVVTKRK